MVTAKLRKALGAVTSLGDPVRRRLYETLASEGRAVSRNEAARLTGIARPLVAYHLDRLVEDGLLATRFERQTGRSGPGAGRPAKLYYRPETPLQVTLPARDYELVARVMAEAIAARADGPIETALDRVARAIGRESAASDSDADGDATDLRRLLLERGYEPATDAGGVICLRNCIFKELAAGQREVICGINLSLLQGMLEALPDAGMTAGLEPAEGRCCVVVRPAAETSASSWAPAVS